ncbi:MAG: peptide chain release factor N(5)-glutamine methyltransferase [bacterium]|nr:peptide chain release factor N(5)-glutamine methyltransferase [bacterium]
MTVSQTLKLAAKKLNSKNIANPCMESEILLSHVLKKPREFILTHGEKKLSPSRTDEFKLLISERIKGKPIAYLTGRKEFYSLDFKVNKNTLIPRPETELMVEEAIKLAAHSSQPITFVDVGTGSGCVIITLAKLIKQPKFFATDISDKAITVARQNAEFHGVDKKIKFFKGNLLSPLFSNLSFGINNPLIILANLPYLTPAQIKNSPTIKYEPKSALDGGPDGLKYYRQLFRQLQALRDIFVLCEIDPGQSGKIKQLSKQLLPDVKLQIKKDLRGLDRLAIIKNF